MEDRILQPKELEGPTTAVAAALTDTRSPPQVPRDDDARVLLSSGEEMDESDEEEFEFEFPFVSRDSPAGTATPADELFADGRIRPFYPVFGRGGVAHGHDGTARSTPAVEPRVRGQLMRLFLEESRASNSSTSSTASSSSAATDDDGGLEGAPPESYCLWTPAGPGSSASARSSSRPPRKSSSTGSMARWRRISELVVGRSHSDGKEKFLFLPTASLQEANKDKPKNKQISPASGRKASATAATEIDTVTAAHRRASLAKGGGGSVPGGTPRRTSLPYREELVGFFANVNGISRSHPRPF